MEKIIIGADHAGFQIKEALKPFLKEMGYAVTDVGTDSERPTDYPDYAARVAEVISTGVFPRGILSTAPAWGSRSRPTGSPASAALCLDEETARMSRFRDDATISWSWRGGTDAPTARAMTGSG